MLTRTAGVELADKGVSIVNVGPGAVATPINDSSVSGSIGTMMHTEPMKLGPSFDVAFVVAIT